MNGERAPSTSRRRFLKRALGTLGVPVLTMPASGQRRAEIAGAAKLQFKQVREFKNSSAGDISPDGRNLCLYTDRRGELNIIEIETGRSIYRTHLGEDVLVARFFAESEMMYAETNVTEPHRYQQAVIDLKAQKSDTSVHSLDTSFFPLAAPFLLASEENSKAQGVALFRAMLPDYSETARVPFAPFTRLHPNDPDGYSPAFSADRKKVVHQVDHALVCRSTEDLSVLWIRRIDPDYHWGAWSVDMTPDGGRVVASVIDQSALHPQKFYVGVYDGRDGSVLARLPISAAMGVSISPDGERIAVGERVILPNGLIEPTVSIYETLTGLQIGKVAHPPVRQGRMSVGIGGSFTPDGKYLISSSRDTKVWSVA